jgi:hypothetical protein
VKFSSVTVRFLVLLANTWGMLQNLVCPGTIGLKK